MLRDLYIIWNSTNTTNWAFWKVSTFFQLKSELFRMHSFFPQLVQSLLLPFPQFYCSQQVCPTLRSLFRFQRLLLQFLLQRVQQAPQQQQRPLFHTLLQPDGNLFAVNKYHILSYPIVCNAWRHPNERFRLLCKHFLPSW